MNAIATETRRPTRLSHLLLVAAVALAASSDLSGAGGAKAPSSTDQHHWYQIGRASWYGKYFQGRQTASGENYDMNRMTCAHRSLPLGTLLRVTNLLNHRTVVVRVNDRGPVPENRVVDLSMAAANFLGMSARGTAPVRLDVVPVETVAQVQWPAADPLLALSPAFPVVKLP
ncbi:MAG TPA: septal ring lytic transglycosylase RlpA family protein [Acidisarcina sp.]